MHVREQCLKTGHQNGALPDIHDIAGGRFTKTHLQTCCFGLVAEAQTGTAAVAPGLVGDNLVNIVFDKARQRAAFALLLKGNARMLLLTATADAKVRATWCAAFRAIIQTAFHLPTGILALIFRQGDFCSFRWQQTCYKQSLAIVPCNTLTEGIKFGGFNSYDLTRRHASLCRVELRHCRDFSQINIIVLIVP
ncbi:conserved protein of unknown function [Enterobacter cancerogenus]|nr:conserved protein of unknown function [Enterobacter cancerogenus]